MAIALVQSKANFATDVNSTLSVTVTATGAGNLLIAMCGGYNNGATVSSVSDGTTGFTQVANTRATYSSGQHWTDIWMLGSSASGKTSITMTISGSGSRTKYIWVMEVSGLINVASDAVNVVNNGSATTNLPGAAVTPTVAAAFIASHAINEGTITAVSNGFTAGTIQDGNASGYRIVSSIAAYNATFTVSGTRAYCSSTAAFKSLGVFIPRFNRQVIPQAISRGATY